MDSRLRILLVEDNPGDVRLLEWYLSRPGSGDFEATRAERLGDALRELACARFDLVLLDLSLPDSSGLDTVRGIRRAAGTTPIVVMTMLDDEETALAALREGAQDYLVKGKFDNRELTRALRYAIERERAEAELARYRDHLEELVSARTRELELANKELEAFAYSVSHDLRAPLRAINGFALALAEDCADRLDATGRDYLERVRAATRRMATLIDDLLSLARIARMPLERQPVDLSALARLLAEELQATAPARKVEFVIQDGMTAQADPALAELVLRNLLDNAWKFTGKHPTARIEVGTTVRDGEPVWYVRDDGAGFDMAHVGSLSAPFQRLHAAGDFAGTGIGLVTVLRIVRRHGGRGWLEGAVEKGATYNFTFATADKEK